MFPYQFKKRQQLNKISKPVRSSISRVKRFYFDAYDGIVKLVKKQNYNAPVGYSQDEWKQVMINQQCAAFLSLKKLVKSGFLSNEQLSKDQLSSLNGYPSRTFDWHHIYTRFVAEG